MHPTTMKTLKRAALASALLSLFPASALATGPQTTPLKPATCTVESMLDDVRAALKGGSPALQRYVKWRLREAALAMPAEGLQAALARETDPAVLEALGGALATKASNAESPALVQPLLARASGDSDPAIRAAAVRGLRGVPSVEFMEKNGGVVTYEQLVRDASPEVRAAVADNLVSESADVYSGHDRRVSEAAVATAAAAEDPAVAAKLLGEVSMEAVGPAAVEQVTNQLRAEDPKLRAAAATALGGVPGAASQGARGSLVDLFKNDKDPAVRKAALQGIARLGMSGAKPVLESLRGVDRAMDPEIDAWLSALSLNLQEWELLLREKQRLRR
ncbi:HEAT repeat domain-containing protein [Pyxidicoccus fallax]|uniref:HEAT repeat domain-containing protein n=1 Tax=Pyxidicoccus fallax TaxID=394095 RepID=A0A848LC48_9BACT|nr:HEAT repeat domain-containing protein [Pyxidicoccus fallax]NMO15812.1 HEAT repeat domain-containing protein [Pyxidicoccus fallax]NPC79403.1 HEAT repeat domain-containing protein [Pyxidicoccus fallax]